MKGDHVVTERSPDARPVRRGAGPVAGGRKRSGHSWFALIFLQVVAARAQEMIIVTALTLLEIRERHRSFLSWRVLILVP